MTTLTINISDSKAKALKSKAAQYGLPLEEMLIASLENLLSHPTEDFKQAMEHVLSKNQELYQRLS